MLWAIRHNCIPIAPAAVGIVNAHGLADALQHTPADIAILVPSVVADLAQNPEQLAYCAQHLQLILYIGGDLPQAIGDAVAQKIPLRCWWGASEVGIPHQLIPWGLGPNDWRYIQFHPSVGAVFDPISDDIYELVMRQDKALSETQSTFAIKGQEGLTEYRTKDLFQPHPHVANAWCWRSRADDIIVFLNGEKTNPVAMEQHVVAQHSELGGALVVGAQRFQAALLLEAAASKLSSGPLSTAEQAALIERVWPSVQEANQFTSAHAKIEKSMILVLGGPLLRAGKGTIQRAASIQQYSNDIETLYQKADITSNDEDDSAEAMFNVKDRESITRLVRASVCDILGQSLPDESSFFESGMDSLMALQILRQLRRGLHRVGLGLSTIYANPTISQLSEAITSDGSDEGGMDETMIMESMWKTYRGLVEQIPRSELLVEKNNPEPTHVILTGSTGTVGTFLLRALLDQPGIQQIYCLNRSENGGRAIQQQRMIERGFNADCLDERVTFLQADLSLPLLGLGEDNYKRLKCHVDLVIHNAWPVNFNLRLAEFQPHLAGLVNLFRFSTEAKSSGHAASIFFVSSVSAVGSPVADRPAPEKVLTLADAPLHTNGYAQSKFLSELLCDAAAQHLDIPVTVLRVGQVAGAIQQGVEWNRKEWFPSLIIGSLSIGCVPDDLGLQFSDVDWLPVDLLANVLVELVSDLGFEKSDKTRVYNLRNPPVTPWSDLLPTVVSSAATLLESGQRLEVVSPSTWLKRLKAAASNLTGDEITTNPAIKLLEFYENYLWGGDVQQGASKKPSMSIEGAYAKSKALCDMPAINQQLIQKWMDEWMN